jgi:hypothetical protein
MIRTYLLVLFMLNLNATHSFSQEITGNIPNAKICETNEGYLVYGLGKGVFLGDFYNKELEKVGSFNRTIDKKLKQVALPTSEQNEIISGYLMGKLSWRTHAKIAINSSTYHIDPIALDPAMNETYGPNNMDNYIPHSTFGLAWQVKTNIKIDANYFELLENSTGGAMKMDRGIAEVAEMNSTYDEGTQIRSFTKNEDAPDTYKLKWKTKLDHGKIFDMEWFDLGEGLLFLQVSEFIDSEYKTFIYWINQENGDILYKHNLELDYDATPYLSQMIVNDKDQLIVIGNSMDKAGDTKLFFMKIDLIEGKISEKSYTLADHIPEGFDGLELKGNLLINFESCTYNESGNLELVGQNLRFYFETVIDLSMEKKSVTWKKWQPFGYTFYEIDSDLEIVKDDYEPVLYSSRKNQSGHSYVMMHDQVKVLYPDLCNLIKGRRLFTVGYGLTTILKSHSQGQQKGLIYAQEEETAGEFNFQYLAISGSEKGKKVFLSKSLASPKNQQDYFFKSANELIEFMPDTKSYTFRTIKV